MSSNLTASAITAHVSNCFERVMFNLLMFNVDWPSHLVSVQMGRMFEYTDSHISEQFREGGNPC